MKRIILAGLLAVLAIPVLPERSFAWGKDPYNSYGMTWLESWALRRKMWIHNDGPLFSYGPYNTPGYVNMHIPQPYHGSYTPADPTLWNRYYAPQYGPYGGYPAYGAAPAAVGGTVTVTPGR
jgi:hypothetical protein